MASYIQSVTSILSFNDPPISTTSYTTINDLLEFAETSSTNINLITISDSLHFFDGLQNLSNTITISQNLVFTHILKRDNIEPVTDVIHFIETINPFEFNDILTFTQTIGFSRSLRVSHNFSIDLVDSFTFSGTRGGKVTDTLIFTQSAIALTSPMNSSGGSSRTECL